MQLTTKFLFGMVKIEVFIYMLTIIMVLAVPVAITLGIVLGISNAKKKRMEHFISELARSKRITPGEMQTVITGAGYNNTLSQGYPQAHQLYPQAHQMYPQAQMRQSYVKPAQQQSQAVYPQQQPQVTYPQQQPQAVYPQQQPQAVYPQQQPQVTHPQQQPQVAYPQQQPQGYAYQQTQPPQGAPFGNPNVNNAYAAPQYYQAPQMQYGKSNFSAMNLLLISGVILIVLAGVIFATTSWEKLGATLKVSLLSLSSMLFFGASILAHKKFGLKQTGVAFYSLGSVFLPVSVLAVGFFELFGKWLSIGGDGKWLLGTIWALPLAATLYIGYRVYKRPILKWMFLFSIAMGIISTALFISESIYSMTLGLALFAIGLLIYTKYGNEGHTFKPHAETFFWIATSFGFISSLNSFFEVELIAVAVTLMLCVLLGFKVCTENSTPSKHIFPIFVIFMVTQCFILLSEALNRAVPMYYVIAITAISFIFVEIKDKGGEERFRTITSDILLSVAAIFSLFSTLGMEGRQLYFEVSVISLSVFVLFSIFGGKIRAMRFLRPLPLFLLGNMLVLVLFNNSSLFTMAVGVLFLLLFSIFPSICGAGEYGKDSHKGFCITAGVFGVALQLFLLADKWHEESLFIFPIAFAMLIVGIVFSYRRKNLIHVIAPMIFSIMSLYSLVIRLFGDFSIPYGYEVAGLAVVVLFLAYMILGRSFHKLAWGGEEKRMPDIFTIAAVVAPIFLIMTDDALRSLVGWLLLALYGFSFWGRLEDKVIQKTLALLGSIAVCLAIYTQDFFDWPDFLVLKIFLILPFFVLLVCKKMLFPEKKTQIDLITFVAGSVTSATLFLEAMINTRIFDALFLGLLSLCVIVCSFFLRSRRWLLLSGIVLIAVAFYLSRSFWLDLAWWAYLLFAGVVLVAIAITSEVYRHRGVNVRNRLSEFFAFWDR